MAYFECSQTFKMFYFHPWGGNQGWVERKHMMAIFRGMSCLAFLECTCLFGLFSIASRWRETEMGTFILLVAFAGKWCHIQRFVLVEDTGLSVLCHGSHHYHKSIFPWSLQAGSYTDTNADPIVLVIMGFCCSPPLLWSTVCWDARRLVLVLFAIGMWLK